VAEISRSYFRLSGAGFTEPQLEERALLLFSDVQKAVDLYLPISDYDLFLEVEEGSIRGKATIATVAATLYAGIAGFGSFVQGVREIDALARTTGGAIVKAATERFDRTPEDVEWSRSDSADIRRVRRLFEQVRDGEIDPDEGARRAVAVLADDEGLSPGIIEGVEAAFGSIYRLPQQLDLPLEGIAPDIPVPEEPAIPAPPGGAIRERPRKPKRIRIEIRREGKDGETHVERILI
jgi:hypothetical protein